MTYVLSDLHGYYDKYRNMLETIRFDRTDTLYVLGDVIDRGPDGIRILRDMMGRENVIPILGNHELTAAMCLPWLMQEITEESLDGLGEEEIAAFSEWLTNGGGPTLRALKLLEQKEREEILEYLREMELYGEVEVGGQSFVLVHAGLDHFESDKPLEEYDLTDFLFGRLEADTVYYPEKTLVFGHTPTRLLGGNDRILFRETMIGIDCGCGFGGPLGCLCLETMEEFYIA